MSTSDFLAREYLDPPDVATDAERIRDVRDDASRDLDERAADDSAVERPAANREFGTAYAVAMIGLVTVPQAAWLVALGWLAHRLFT